MKEFNPFEYGHSIILNTCPLILSPSEFEGVKTKVLYNQPVGIPTIDSVSICKGADNWNKPDYEYFHYLLPRGNHNYWYLDSIFGYILPKMEAKIRDEYRKFIEENKYRRIARITYFRPLSIQWSQRTKSHGNNIKYASRRFPNGMGK